jgi:tetratricopeptide (TPR) repeat protein
MTPPNYFTLSLDLVNAGAVDLYRKATEANPNHPEAWYYLGRCLSYLANWNDEAKAKALEEEALEAYTMALTLRPTYHDAWSFRRITLLLLDLEEEPDFEEKLTESYHKLTQKLTSLETTLVIKLLRQYAALAEEEGLYDLYDDYRLVWTSEELDLFKTYSDGLDLTDLCQILATKLETKTNETLNP